MGLSKIQSTSKREQGFSLLEAVIAMLIMMIGCLGIAGVFAFAVKNNTGSLDRTVALAVAQQEIERLRSLQFLDAALNATPTIVTPSTVYNGGRSYRVRTVIVDTTPSLKTIQIQVTPLSGSDAWAVRSVQLTAERASFDVGPYIGGP